MLNRYTVKCFVIMGLVLFILMTVKPFVSYTQDIHNPVIHIEGNPQYEEDSAVFSAEPPSVGVPPFRYIWRVNGTVVSQEKETEYVFKKAGEYTIECRIIDSRRRVYQQSRTIVVRQKDASSPDDLSQSLKKESLLEFTWSDGYPEAGKIVHFRLLNPPADINPAQVQWFVDDTKIHQGETASHIFTQEGKYTVKVSAVNKEGKKLSGERVFQAASEDLTFIWTWSPVRPHKGGGLTFKLSRLSGGVPPYEIRWIIQGKEYQGDRAEISVASDEDIDVIVLVKDSRGQIKMGSETLSVSPETLNFTLWWSASDPIRGQTLRWEVRDLKGGSPPYEIFWKINGEPAGEGDFLRHTFTETGMHQIEVEVIDSEGKSAKGIKTYDIQWRPQR